MRLVESQDTRLVESQDMCLVETQDMCSVDARTCTLSRANAKAAAFGRSPPFVISFVWTLNQAQVLARNAAHALRLNKTDLLALNMAHA